MTQTFKDENGVEQPDSLPTDTQCNDCLQTDHSFYRAIIDSPQWEAWYEHAENNHLFDVAEAAECGWMSQRHFQAFLQFVKENDL